MTARYKAHHPEHYPIAWLSAVKMAAERVSPDSTDNPWVSIDWARGEAGAVSRMKRLRTFREGLRLHKHQYPSLEKLFAEGYELTFRKRPFRDVWDVQVSWKLQTSKQETLRVLQGIVDTAHEDKGEGND